MPPSWSAVSTIILSIVTVSLVPGCTVGPDYARPATAVPAVYKEAGLRPLQPKELAPRGAWWTIYGDPVLDGLVRQVEISNQTLKANEAAYRQATAVVASARSAFFPTLSGTASAQRSGSGGGTRTTSGSTVTSGSTTGGTTGGTSVITGTGTDSTGTTTTTTGTTTGTLVTTSGSVSNLFRLSASASWAPDFWGKVRRTVESDVASAQASAADLASARLSLQAELATAYFQLRVADELKTLLETSAEAYARSLQITQNQHAAGTIAGSDVSQAQAQLESTRAQAIAVGIQRAQLEHAIAVLIGQPPAGFAIAPAPLTGGVPGIPLQLPSSLLERRPDIAAAERRLIAANALIGVAEAAYFPDITLSADYGASATKLATLFNPASASWAVGSSLLERLFDGGSRAAQVQQARASYDQLQATYRQTVLTGFQQVEDGLAALALLARQAQAQEAALAAARRAEQLILNQYRAGTVAYTSVIVAQTTALGNAQTTLNLRQSRLTESVALIQALGGGWDLASLPSRDQVEAETPLDFNPFFPPPRRPAP